MIQGNLSDYLVLSSCKVAVKNKKKYLCVTLTNKRDEAVGGATILVKQYDNVGTYLGSVKMSANDFNAKDKKFDYTFPHALYDDCAMCESSVVSAVYGGYTYTGTDGDMALGYFSPAEDIPVSKVPKKLTTGHRNVSHLRFMRIPALLLFVALFVVASAIFTIIQMFSYDDIGETFMYEGVEYEFVDGEYTEDGDVRVIGLDSRYIDVTIPATLDGHTVTGIKTGCFKGSNLVSVTVEAELDKLEDYAFQGCSWLISAKLNGVGAIGEYTFQGCNLLSHFEADSAKNIGAYAFAGCSSLKSASLPSAVSIGECAFKDSGLTSLTLSGSISEIRTKAFANTLLESFDCHGVSVISESVFDGCSSLKDVSMSKGVTEIEANAFYGCKSLISISLPGTLTELGESAFSGCESLTTIRLPSGVEDVPANAFSGCTSLKSITFTQQIKSIGESAFSGCTSLTVANLPTKLKTLGEKAFYGCSAITTVYVPESVTEVGDDVFYGCTAVEEIKMPYMGATGDVTTFSSAFGKEAVSLKKVELTSGAAVPDYAFYGLEALTEVTIGNSSMKIGKSAFEGCVNLVTFTVPKGVLSIGDNAFSGCIRLYDVLNLSNLKISRGSESYGGVALYALRVSNTSDEHDEYSEYTDNLRFVYSEDEVWTLIDYTGDSTSLTLSAVSKDGKDISSYEIAPYTFVSDKLESFTAGSCVTAIGYETFKSCANLKSVNLAGSSVTAIGNSVFSGCASLSELAYPEALSTIGEEAFLDCAALKNADMSATHLEEVGTSAFSGAGITSLILPSDSVTLNTQAFANCTSLTSADLSSSAVTTLTEDLFVGCVQLAAVKLPSSLKTVEASAFNGCSALSSVNLSDTSVATIAESAFYGCKVASLTFPSTLTYVAAQAFGGDTSLSSIVVRSAAALEEGAFEGCYSLRKVKLLNSGITAAEGTFGSYVSGELKIYCYSTIGTSFDVGTIYTHSSCVHIGENTWIYNSAGDDVIDEASYNTTTQKAATCFEDGILLYTCSRCGKDSYTETVSALEHSFDSNGKCSHCGKTHYSITVDEDNFSTYFTASGFEVSSDGTITSTNTAKGTTATLKFKIPSYLEDNRSFYGVTISFVFGCSAEVSGNYIMLTVTGSKAYSGSLSYSRKSSYSTVLVSGDGLSFTFKKSSGDDDNTDYGYIQSFTIDYLGN